MGFLHPSPHPSSPSLPPGTTAPCDLGTLPNKHTQVGQKSTKFPLLEKLILGLWYTEEQLQAIKLIIYLKLHYDGNPFAIYKCTEAGGTSSIYTMLYVNYTLTKPRKNKHTYKSMHTHTHMHIFLFSPLYTPKDSSIHRMPWTYLFHGV